jgi:hypothetical protein
MPRIAAHEKFLWKGWEFRQSMATSQEVHWEMRLPKLRVRLIYRDIQDPETPPEWTAFIHFQGLEEGKGDSLFEGGNGVAASHEVALEHAERDFIRKLAHAAKLAAEIKRGNPIDPGR